MPSFDIVSEVNVHEVTNAVNQAQKEAGQRFDLKGADPKIEWDHKVLKLSASEAFKLQALREILINKLAKREISLKNIKPQEPEISPTGRATQLIHVKQGIDPELAKKISSLIKQSRLKVQASIQGDQVRVSGKNRDDLQAVIAMLRQADLPIALTFENFRE